MQHFELSRLVAEQAGKPWLEQDCGLFCGLLRAPDTLRKRCGELRYRIDSPGRSAALGIKAAA